MKRRKEEKKEGPEDLHLPQDIHPVNTTELLKQLYIRKRNHLQMVL